MEVSLWFLLIWNQHHICKELLAEVTETSMKMIESTWSSRWSAIFPMSIAIQPQEGLSAPSLHIYGRLKLKFRCKMVSPSWHRVRGGHFTLVDWENDRGDNTEGEMKVNCWRQDSWSPDVPSVPAGGNYHEVAVLSLLWNSNDNNISQLGEKLDRQTLHILKITFSSLRMFTSSSRSKTPLKPLPYKQEGMF